VLNYQSVPVRLRLLLPLPLLRLRLFTLLLLFFLLILFLAILLLLVLLLQLLLPPPPSLSHAPSILLPSLSSPLPHQQGNKQVSGQTTQRHKQDACWARRSWRSESISQSGRRQWDT